jgi:hypothetical protein
MKWTNPERLDMYGLRLVGWPEGVPSQNPSSLKTGQNKLLLDALRKGTMRFERLSHEPSSAVDEGEQTAEHASGDAQETAAEDFSWAYDADAGPSSPVQERTSSAVARPTTTISACSSMSFIANETTPSESLDEPVENQQGGWNLEDDINGDDVHYRFTWPDALHDLEDSLWVEEHCLDSERPRKRLRSEEPVMGES